MPGGSSGGSSRLSASRISLNFGIRYRGIHPPTRILVWSRGNETNLRTGIPLRAGRLCLFLDQIGPFSQTVEDVIMLLETISGHDPLDSTSYPASVPGYLNALKGKLQPCKLGLPKEFFGEGMDDEVRKAIDQAIAWYKEQGYEMVEISMPTTDLSVPVYYVIATAEASSNLARYDGIRYTSRSERSASAIDVYSKTRGEGFGGSQTPLYTGILWFGRVTMMPTIYGHRKHGL